MIFSDLYTIIFLNVFWNPELSEIENTAVNFDWYHPSISTRHTPEEVRSWFDENSLKIIHFHEDHYGIPQGALLIRINFKFI